MVVRPVFMEGSVRMDWVLTRTPETSVIEFRDPGDHFPRLRLGKTSLTRALPDGVEAIETVAMSQVL